MDTSTLLLWIVVILAVVAIFGFLVYRRRTRTTITGPFNTSVSIDASNDPPSTAGGITMEGVTAGKDVKAQNKTGGSVTMKTIDAKGNVIATTENPPDPGSQSEPSA